MEKEILRETGCKWSRIIYPGFKGYLSPFQKQRINSLDIQLRYQSQLRSDKIIESSK